MPADTSSNVTSEAPAAVAATTAARRTIWDWAGLFEAHRARGEVLGDLVRKSGKTRRYVQKALWLASWPEDLKSRVQANPKTFPARVLLNHFASQMKAFGPQSLEGWRRLRREVERLEQRPLTSRLRKGASGTKRPVQVSSPPVSLASALRVQEALRVHLQTMVRVDGEEIRIRHHGEADLERLLEVIGVPL